MSRCDAVRERKSPLGTHRFQRAVRGERRIDRNQTPPKSHCSRLVILGGRCVPPMGLLPTTARWKRCVPREGLEKHQKTSFQSTHRKQRSLLFFCPAFC